jgi:(S)-ureidoglycine aminohydrolase
MGQGGILAARPVGEKIYLRKEFHMVPPVLDERAVVKKGYTLLPQEGLCESPLPNYQEASVKILAAPVIGADFAESLINFRPGGKTVKPIQDGLEYFIYGLSGKVRLDVKSERRPVGPGDFAYLPPNLPFSVLNESKEIASILLLKRPYLPFEKESPSSVFGSEASTSGEIYMGLEGVVLKKLIPPDPAFDMAMNIFTFQPGTALPVIETHIMQHGVFMLQGQGLYYLGDRWYQVKAGDFIWMGNFTPQSFYCTGRIPAQYIYYKDINRDVTF